MKNNESAPQYPSKEVEDLMHLKENGFRNADFRGNEETLPEGRPTLGTTGVETGFSNPAYGGDTDLEVAAHNAPNAYVELANMQNVRDADELSANKERVAQIEESPLSIFKRKELGRLADRAGVLDPNGDMDESHKRFKDANIDALIENAHAAAERARVEINDGDKAA